jgi:hypothetical protein
MKLYHVDAKRRNEWLEAVVIKFIPGGYVTGDPDKPVVILRDAPGKKTFALSCYVSNFDLHLLDAPEGDHLLTIRLKKNLDIDHSTVRAIQRWLVKAQHRQVYVIGKCDVLLWITGWNFMDRLNKIGRYPVFARNKPLIFWEKETADQVAAELKDYKLAVC